MKVKEYIGRILLYFDLRFNFIDSTYLRDNFHVNSDIKMREYWALILFWEGVFPDKKFEIAFQEFKAKYNLLERLLFILFKALLKSLRFLARQRRENRTIVNSAGTSKLDYSQLLLFTESLKKINRSESSVSTLEDDFIIVIPVYNAAQYVKKCLASVLETTDRCKIVIVNDCSTEPETIKYLETLQTNPRIQILENDRNLGFVGSANVGFNNSGDKHVLLLNSDTIVFSNWFNRIAHYFVSNPKAWTVTPLSNAATVFSIPFSSETDLDVETSKELDQFLSQNFLKAEKVVSAPTCHGFCVAIHKDALARIGGFNEAVFGRGYGEENDFSMRVIASGYSNIIATNTLVHHFGSKSFGSENLELSKVNMQALLKLHPGYLNEVNLFLEESNFLHIRALSLIYLSRLKVLDSKLVVSHALGGGVEKSIEVENNDFQGLLVIATPRTHASISVEFRYRGNREVLVVTGIESTKLLESVFELLSPENAQFDHILGFPREAIESFNLNSHKYSVRLHDYTYLCPRIHLSGTNHRDCGLPDIKTCTSCLTDDFDKSIDIEGWRIRNTTFLFQSEAIVSSSIDVQQRYLKVNQNLNISVSPVDIPISSQAHSFPKDSGDSITICVLGHLNQNKGLKNVDLFVRYLQKTKSSIRVVHLGKIIGERIKETKNFINYGEYNDTEHLYLLLKEIRPDLFWFPSEVPETFSFTLSEALPFGIPISYFDTGAIAERLQNYEWRIPLKIASDAAEIHKSIYEGVMKFRVNQGD